MMSKPTMLRFEHEWQPLDEGIQAQELRTTLARLEIWVGGRCVTAAQDVLSGNVSRSIYVSLYPLAEWIAFNWWLMRFDGHRDGMGDRVDVRNLRSAGDGFIWPNLEVLPAGGVTRLRWFALPGSTQSSLFFIGDGRAWVGAAGLQAVLGDLVQAVVVRLEEHGINDTSIQDEWSRIVALDPEEVEFYEAAARLGLDPFSEGVGIADAIITALQQVPVGLRTDFFDAVPPGALVGALI